MQVPQSAQQTLLHSLISEEAKGGLTLSRPEHATVALLTQILIEMKIANGEKVSVKAASQPTVAPDARRAVFAARAADAAAAVAKPKERFVREAPKAPSLEEVEAAEAVAYRKAVEAELGKMEAKQLAVTEA